MFLSLDRTIICFLRSFVRKDYCNVLEISFLKVHAHAVLLKTQLQIHHNIQSLLFLVEISGSFQVVNVVCFLCFSIGALLKPPDFKIVLTNI